MLDYVSPQRTAPRKFEASAGSAALEEVCKALENTGVALEDRIYALALSIHRWALEPDQVCRLCRLFPNPALSRSSSVESTAESRRVSAFQFDASNLRHDIFVMLFNRSKHQWMLPGKEVLRDPSLFSGGCLREMRRRLGYQRVLDVMDCCQPECSEDKLLGRSYDLRLFLHEEWMACQVFVALAEKEDGQNIVKCDWSERSSSADMQGIEFFVPASWVQALPTAGTFKFYYRSERPEFILPNERRALAERWCGWEKQ